MPNFHARFPGSLSAARQLCSQGCFTFTGFFPYRGNHTDNEFESIALYGADDLNP
jgi:hypothetical protein